MRRGSHSSTGRLQPGEERIADSLSFGGACSTRTVDKRNFQLSAMSIENGCVYALPHFDVADDHRDRAIGVDAQVCVRGKALVRRRAGGAGHVEGYPERSTGLHKATTRDVHAALQLRSLLDRCADANVGPAAADVSGHSLVDIRVSRIRVAVRSADADMIWPDWQ